MTSRPRVPLKLCWVFSRVCMVYRGQPLTAQPTVRHQPIVKEAVCRPLVGEAVTEKRHSRVRPVGAFATECCCVREGDAVSGAGSTAARAGSMPCRLHPAPTMTNMPNPMAPQQPAGGGAAPQMALPAAGPMGGMAPEEIRLGLLSSVFSQGTVNASSIISTRHLPPAPECQQRQNAGSCWSWITQ